MGTDGFILTWDSTRTLAADIWASNFRDDPMSETAGQRYRQMILAKGGSVDELDMIRAFLGRAPSAAAYLQDLGVDPAQ